MTYTFTHTWPSGSLRTKEFLRGNILVTFGYVCICIFILETMTYTYTHRWPSGSLRINKFLCGNILVTYGCVCIYIFIFDNYDIYVCIQAALRITSNKKIPPRQQYGRLWICLYIYISLENYDIYICIYVDGPPDNLEQTNSSAIFESPVHIQLNIHVCTHTLMYTHKYVCVYVYTRTYIYVYT